MREQQYRLMVKYADGKVGEYFSFYSKDPAGLRIVAKRLDSREYEEHEDVVVAAWIEGRTIITTEWETTE